MQKYSHPVIFVLETITFKEKYNTEDNITFNAGSGDAFLPTDLGPTVLITEAGQPHHCPSPILQTGVFKSLGFFTSSYFDFPESSWDGEAFSLCFL